MARIVSSLLIVGFLVFAIAEGMPNPLTQPAIAQVGFLGLVFIVVGSLAGWRRELAGGILSLAGVLALIEPTRINGKITWFFAVLAAPGVLCLASGLLTKRIAR